MTLKLVIEFSELNINVNVIPANDADTIEKIDALRARLDKKENELKAALAQDPPAPSTAP